jgi:hypothetical protein
VAKSLAHAESYGTQAVVCFAPQGELAHGNFLESSYRAICKDAEWRRRLMKVHTSARRALPAAENGRWRELDSCMSSDALLMNVFCYPRVLASAEVTRMLGIEVGARGEFGYPARVPLKNGGCDRTEVDLRLGHLLIEAKLTETDFQRTPKARLHGYRDFEEIFDCERLPQSENFFESYQMVRNLLAAHARGSKVCVLLDARRPDLLERYYEVVSAVRPIELRTRCQVLMWQELAQVLPEKLQCFLQIKYGIG